MNNQWTLKLQSTLYIHVGFYIMDQNVCRPAQANLISIIPDPSLSPLFLYWPIMIPSDAYPSSSTYIV